jgi:isoamylase
VDEFRDMVKALTERESRSFLTWCLTTRRKARNAAPRCVSVEWTNSTYYILEPDQSRYANYSGTGNTLNANHPIVRRIIVDSLRYWVEEMHADGFRFHLASIIARDSSGAVMSNPPVLWDIESDPVFADTFGSLHGCPLSIKRLHGT